jgi:hypothetical protein
MNHKPDCASNSSCAVSHVGGTCPDQRACDCTQSRPETNKNDKYLCADRVHEDIVRRALARALAAYKAELIEKVVGMRKQHVLDISSVAPNRIYEMRVECYNQALNDFLLLLSGDPKAQPTNELRA